MTTITVIGGTGYTGSAIVKDAAARGHRVISVSRSLPAEPVDGVEYVAAPATEAAAQVAEADVVVAALSPRGDNVGTLPGVYRQLAQQAADAGARFVAIGGFSSLRPAEGAPRFAEGDGLPPEFAGEAREMNSILGELLEGSIDVDWLFVSPAATYGDFAPGEKLGTYRVGGEIAILDADGNSEISGADFAQAIVDEIDNPAHHRAHIQFVH